MATTPGFGAEAIPKHYPPCGPAEGLPGSQPSKFVQEYGISARAQRSLSHHGGPEVVTGSPTRKMLEPKRGADIREHTFVDRWGEKHCREGPRWDVSQRRVLWFGERSQYRKGENEHERSAEQQEAATNFMLAMRKIREKATSGNKYVVGGQKDAVIDLQKVFDELDDDGSGVIDTNEFVVGMLRLGVDLTQEELESVFAFFDRDGGGIEFGELQWAFFNKELLGKGGSLWAGAAQHDGQGSFNATLSKTCAESWIRPGLRKIKINPLPEQASSSKIR